MRREFEPHEVIENINIRVMVFFSIPGQPNIDERFKGYKDSFAKYPGINVIDVFDMKGDSGLAMDQTKDYLLRTGANRIDAIVCLEAASGRDVAEEFRRSGVKDRLLVRWVELSFPRSHSGRKEVHE